MHCSANIGEQGDTALFFGLSGTGKTTLSADPHALPHRRRRARLVRRRACSTSRAAATRRSINLSRRGRAGHLSHDADVRHDPRERRARSDDTRKVEFEDQSITENTRASLPAALHPATTSPSGRGGHPKNIVFLTADAFGVLPPIAKLTREQAMYYFLSGYTAKVAGTERGVTEPQATFSACFGAVFLVWHPDEVRRDARQAHRRARLERVAREHGLERRRVRRGQAHEARPHARHGARGARRQARRRRRRSTDPMFGLAVPHVGSAMCRPRCSIRARTWSDAAAYDAQAKKLAEMFREELRAVRQRDAAIDAGRCREGERTSRGSRRATASMTHSRSSAIRSGTTSASIALALRLVDTRVFQRLRYVRQLGLAFLVYPGATPLALRARARRVPSRAAHARAASTSAASSRRSRRDECAIVRVRRAAARRRALSVLARARGDRRAAPRGGRAPADHERRDRGGPARASSATTRPSAIMALIRGESASPLQGLISGSLDLDKIEYLKRDALMCGVTYGEIDVDRLLNSLTHRRGSRDAARPRSASSEKGLVGARVAAVREVSDVPQRVLAPRGAQRDRDVQAPRRRRAARAARSSARDARRLHRRGAAARARGARADAAARRAARAPAVQARVRVPRRGARRRTRRVDRGRSRARASRWRMRSRASSGSRRASCCSTIRRRRRCSASTSRCVRRDGSVRRLTAAGWEGAINLPKLSEELYGSARWLRVFTCRARAVDRAAIIRLPR